LRFSVVRNEAQKPTVTTHEVAPIVELEARPEVKLLPYDIDKLAYAVAMAETHNCTEGYGLEYNNCMGIKNGNTAPCTKIGRNRMCIYERPEDSYAAFKKIWSKWYDGLPTLKKAQKWSGNDRAQTWLRNVNHYYYQP
jgi:hypothetical protein